MNYLPTPLNIAALILIIMAIYSLITSPEGGDGLQNFWVVPMIIGAILLLIIDYFLQTKITSFKIVLLIGSLILLVLYLSIRFFLKS